MFFFGTFFLSEAPKKNIGLKSFPVFQAEARVKARKRQEAKDL